MKKKCKNCKYYEKITSECWCNKFVEGGDVNEGGRDIISYHDHDRYGAVIEVGENFGCIHFKEKDKN